MSKITPPNFKGESYSCPHCGAFSQMTWDSLVYSKPLVGYSTSNFWHVTCGSCKQPHIWMQTNHYIQELDETHNSGELIYPSITIVPLPSEDMPDDIKKDYLEAASIYQKSPRGAVALLRLGLQKLCIHLGGKGENINNDLAALAKDELVSKKLIKSADIIRIVGNNAVHPGTISDDDFDDVSFKLFKLINMIVQQGITEPKEVDETFNVMPENARKAAENRDKPLSK
ncbi:MULTISPECIES: DUF4145 domain-containing protein [unclassified Providencia]|uniref:DUF4145 domain-containing protein n=1 Tax=unclassified Providencia TaxID=2633465 RepID=UPI001E553A8F|nr:MULTISPECIES: DUF4145 domain-containing protein [unclassified Providencia]